MKNKITDLNDYLFESIERLNDDDLDLDTEIQRATTICKLAKAIVANGSLALSAQKHFDEMGRQVTVVNPLIEGKNDTK